MKNTQALQQLPRQYSRIFDQRLPIPMQIRSGWIEIVDDLFDRLTALVSSERIANLRIVQVKEKFGLLRIYFILTGGSPRLLEMIQAAANEACESSLYCCEICGSRGVLYEGPWWRVRCDHCLETR